MEDKDFIRSRKIIKEYSMLKLEYNKNAVYQMSRNNIKAVEEKLEQKIFNIIKDEFEIYYTSNLLEEGKQAKETIIREAQEEKNKLISEGKRRVENYIREAKREVYEEQEKMLGKKLLSFITQGVIFATIVGLLVNQWSEVITYIKENLTSWTAIPVWGWTIIISICLAVFVLIYVLIQWISNKVKLIDNFKKEFEEKI